MGSILRIWAGAVLLMFFQLTLPARAADGGLAPQRIQEEVWALLLPLPTFGYVVRPVGADPFPLVIMNHGVGATATERRSKNQSPMCLPAGSVTSQTRMSGCTTETSFGFLLSSLILFIPITALIILGLRGSGFGRLLFAVGDNPVAARLSGVRVWQVLLALYIVSALLAALAGFLIAGLVKTASLSLVESSVLPSVAAAVIGGTSIMGGRGGYAGTIVGALILTVLAALLTILEMPEGVRQILFGSIVVFVAAAYTRVTGES